VQFGTAPKYLTLLLWRSWREATDEVPGNQFRHPGSLAISKRYCNLGKRAITTDADLRLARYYKISEGTFLGLQSDYELRIERRKLNDKLDFIVPRAAQIGQAMPWPDSHILPINNKRRPRRNRIIE
jgi:hypothetical protein